MDKDYVIPTAQDFKIVGKRLLKDYEQNISNIRKDLDKELYSFPDIDIDNYIVKCVKARQEVFDTTLKAHNALQWLIKQQGFIKFFSRIPDAYLQGNTKEQVIKRLTQDIQNYYRLFLDEADTELNIDIYQLQQKYQDKSISYLPYQEGCYTIGNHAGLSYNLQSKRFFELIRDLCIFYGDWLDGLYTRRAEYIKKDLNDLEKNLKNIHLIINKPNFVDCFPKDLLSNILPSSDIKQNAIEQNSIKYLENLIKQYKKAGLRKDNYLERRLKIQDLTRIIMKSYPKDQLEEFAKKSEEETYLIDMVYEMMTLPIITIGSVEESLTKRSINLEYEQDIEDVSSYSDNYEGYDDYMKELIEANGGYEEYLRVMSEDD